MKLIRLAVISVLAVASAAAAPAPMAPPEAELLFTGKDTVKTATGAVTRYALAVFNRSDFPQDLFDPAPDLEPCGLNKNSSRAWVEIHAGGTGDFLNTFCALTSPNGLGSLWFVLPQGQAVPASVYIVINDRRTSVRHQSNVVDLSGPLRRMK